MISEKQEAKTKGSIIKTFRIFDYKIQLCLRSSAYETELGLKE